MVNGLESPLLRNVLLFGRVLRGAGIPVSPDQSRSFARALAWIDLGRRDQVFHAARSLLVHRQEDLALFEAIFDRFWRDQGTAGGPGGVKAAREQRPRRHQPRPSRKPFGPWPEDTVYGTETVRAASYFTTSRKFSRNLDLSRLIALV